MSALSFDWTAPEDPSQRWVTATTPSPKPPVDCVHCGRLTQCLEGGWAYVGDAAVCHPNEADRPDCFRMITVYGHGTRNCDRCTKDRVWEPITNAEILAGVITALEQAREAIEDLDRKVLTEN